MENNKKKKSATMKVLRKARPSKPHEGNEDLEENFFYNQDLIRDLVDKFALPQVVDRIADFDYE